MRIEQKMAIADYPRHDRWGTESTAVTKLVQMYMRHCTKATKLQYIERLVQWCGSTVAQIMDSLLPDYYLTEGAERMIRPWHKFVTREDMEVFNAAGYGKNIGYGTRPVLLIIDAHYSFIGDQPEPILESVKQYRTSCGEKGWKAIGAIKELLKIFREKNFPVVYTVSERRKDFFDSGVQKGKNFRHMESTTLEGSKGSQIPQEIAPQVKDILISKKKPSAFFATPLMSYLNDLDIDTVFLAGCTTSGCIRATAVDSYSYNFKTAIIEECVFDRFESSHAINLFDLNTKYADVVYLDEAIVYLKTLSSRP